MCACIIFHFIRLVHCKRCDNDNDWTLFNRAYYSAIFQSYLTLQYSILAILLVREISPVELAGQFSTFYVVLFRCGFLVAYLLGIGLPSATDPSVDYQSNYYWKIMLAFPLIPMAIQTIFLISLYTYDTPKYLYLNKRRRECREALSKIYTTEYDIKRSLVKLKALEQDGAGGKSSEVSWSDLFSRTYIKALVVVLCKL